MNFKTVHQICTIVIAVCGLSFGNIASSKNQLERQELSVQKTDTPSIDTSQPVSNEQHLEILPKNTEKHIEKSVASVNLYESESRSKRDLSWVDFFSFGRFAKTQRPFTLKTTNANFSNSRTKNDSSQIKAQSPETVKTDASLSKELRNKVKSENSFSNTKEPSMTTSSNLKTDIISMMTEETSTAKPATPVPRYTGDSRQHKSSNSEILNGSAFTEFIQKANRAPWMVDEDRYLSTTREDKLPTRTQNENITTNAASNKMSSQTNETTEAYVKKSANVQTSSPTEAPKGVSLQDTSTEQAVVSPKRERKRKIRHERHRTHKLRRIKSRFGKPKAKLGGDIKTKAAPETAQTNRTSPKNATTIAATVHNTEQDSDNQYANGKIHIEGAQEEHDNEDNDYDDNDDTEKEDDDFTGNFEGQNDHPELNFKPDCPSCGGTDMYEEDVKDLRLSMLTDTLMRKLRIDPQELSVMERADPSTLEKRMPKLPRSVLDQTYRDNVQDEKEDFYARDKEIIIPGTDMGRDCLPLDATGCYEFDLEDKLKGEIASAELWLYKTRDRHDISGQTFIVHELERDSSNGSLQRKNMLVRKDTFTKEDWVNFNMTWPLRRWADGKSRRREMLAIRCKTCSTWNHRRLFGAKYGYTPLLIIKYADNNHLRGKRAEDDCDPRAKCCKRPLTVDFHAVNLHRILRPLNLSVGFCYGYCDGVDHFTYNHTSLKQRTRWTLPTSSGLREQLKPCCVPLLLKDAMIITEEDNAIHAKILPKVIVESCGCV